MTAQPKGVACRGCSPAVFPASSTSLPARDWPPALAGGCALRESPCASGQRVGLLGASIAQTPPFGSTGRTRLATGAPAFARLKFCAARLPTARRGLKASGRALPSLNSQAVPNEVLRPPLTSRSVRRPDCRTPRETFVRGDSSATTVERASASSIAARPRVSMSAASACAV